jgi:hypothetical protein
VKILHTEASHGWGGQEIRILTEMALLAARGHEVALATASSAPIYAAARQRGLTVHDLPLGRRRLAGVLALRRLLREQHFDVVNAHSSIDTWLVALALVGWPEAPALVRTRHISAPVSRDPATRWLYDRACTAVVTTGERLKQSLRTYNGFTRARIESIPTGVDLARFTPQDPVRARARLGLSPEGLSDEELLDRYLKTLETPDPRRERLLAAAREIFAAAADRRGQHD